MSYILEALKRSEQERHQGELNHTTIDTIMLPSKQARHQWWPYLLIVTLAINLLVYLYFQFSEDSVDARDSVKTVQEAETSVQENIHSNKDFLYGQERTVSIQRDEQNQSSFIKESTHSQLTSEKPLPEHLSQTPKLTKRYDLSTQLQATSQVTSQATSQANSPLNSYQSKKKTYTDEGFEIIKPKATTRSISPQDTLLSQSEASNANYDDEYQKETKSVAHSVTPEAGPLQQAATQQVKLENFEDTYHLNDLDLSFTKGIPDIRFNSHIYSTNPADRRVMINDLYLREGQDFSGITIETIGEFYILLSKDSRRFKIPVLRDWFTPDR